MKYFGILIVIFISACSSTPLLNGVEHVRLTNHKLPNNCKFLGDIIVTEGNRITGKFISNSDLESGARNDLKNKACKLGGNAVVILNKSSSITGKNNIKTSVSITGNVYYCK